MRPTAYHGSLYESSKLSQGIASPRNLGGPTLRFARSSCETHDGLFTRTMSGRLQVWIKILHQNMLTLTVVLESARRRPGLADFAPGSSQTNALPHTFSHRIQLSKKHKPLGKSQNKKNFNKNLKNLSFPVVRSFNLSHT